MVPRELIALADSYKEKQRLANYRAGIVAAAIYNVNRSKKTQQPIKPFDFFEARRISDPQALLIQLTAIANHAEQKRKRNGNPR
jgi:hypothetical protein